MKRNRYIFLRLKLVAVMFTKGKITPAKVFNAAVCMISYWLKREKTGRLPFMINMELWNECNSNCIFCRNAKGEIYDHNPRGGGKPIPKGVMPFEMYADIIDQAKSALLMAVLYINGEPLLYKDLPKAVRFASERGIPTMIATNGILLNEKNMRELLQSGLDFIKIAVSGFTQEVYSIQHRVGDIEKIKSSIEQLVRINKEGAHRCVIMLDYIYYKHNAHELAMFQDFCDRLGIMLNLRQGNIKQMEETEPGFGQPSSAPEHLPACVWLWEVLSINWNGDMLPCCDYVVWSLSRPYAAYQTGKTRIADIWNGDEAKKLRAIHRARGRKSIPICAECQRQGIAFKY
jgi:radical SAM protein with 4Fe4S-binding SPASM domain